MRRFSDIALKLKYDYDYAFILILKKKTISGRCGHGSPCMQLCYELHDGMYECDCTEGYELDRNGYSCQGKWTMKMKLNFKCFVRRHSFYRVIKMLIFSYYLYLVVMTLHLYLQYMNKMSFSHWKDNFTSRFTVLMFSLLLSYKNHMTMINMLTLTLCGMTGCTAHNKSLCRIKHFGRDDIN